MSNSVISRTRHVKVCLQLKHSSTIESTAVIQHYFSLITNVHSRIRLFLHMDLQLIPS